MIFIGWRSREDGGIVVWDLPSGPERLPMLAAEYRQQFDVGEAKYHDLNAAAERKYGLPDGLLGASEWRESGFDKRAYRIERTQDGTPIYQRGRLLTGVGLNQLTDGSIKGNHTDEELFDPALNIELAAKHFAELMVRYGDDVPKLAAANNAGSARPDASNPWNLHQYGTHVSSIVSAFNYYRARLQLHQEQELVYLEGVAVRQEFDLKADIDWMGRRTLPPDDEAPPTPRNDVPSIREAVTLPDVRKDPKS